MIKINIVNLNKKRRIDIRSVENIVKEVLRKAKGKRQKAKVSRMQKLSEKNIGIPKRFLRRKLHSGQVKSRNLNIIFVSDKYIKRLNKIYKHRDSATDVLCFSMPEETDIFISSDRARVNSRRFKTTFENELYLYVIHGILHMLGFEDKTARGRSRMEGLQEKILSQVT